MFCSSQWRLGTGYCLPRLHYTPLSLNAIEIMITQFCWWTESVLMPKMTWYATAHSLNQYLAWASKSESAEYFNDQGNPCGSTHCMQVQGKEDGETYVLKRIALVTKDDLDSARLAAFKEVEVLRELHHPHVVRIMEHFWDEEEQDLCVVMTYCEVCALACMGASSWDRSSSWLKILRACFCHEYLCQWFIDVTLLQMFPVEISELSRAHAVHCATVCSDANSRDFFVVQPDSSYWNPVSQWISCGHLGSVISRIELGTWIQR